MKKQLKEKFPDLDIVVQYMPTGNVSAKLKTERTNIEADIILDLETAHIVKLEKDFADLSNFDSSIYLDGLVQSKNYFPWTKYTMTLTIDKNYFEKHNLEIPKTYNDLLKLEYKNLIAMPNTKTSGSGYAFLLNAVNFMGEDEAIEYFKSLKENLREFTTFGSGPIKLINLFGANGIISKTFGFNIIGMFGIILGSILYSFSVAFLILDDGFHYIDNNMYNSTTMPLSLLINNYEGNMMLGEAAIISLIILTFNIIIKGMIYLINRKEYKRRELNGDYI